MDCEIINQSVSITDRKRIELTGISDVTSFCENEVEAEYSGGCVAVEGENLKIDAFSSETGILSINGTVSGLFYFSKNKLIKKRGVKKAK